MDQVCADKALDDELKRKGFVVVPFLDEEQVDEVRALHDRLFPDIPSDLYSTVFCENPDLRRQVVTGIREIIGERFRMLLPGHSNCFSLFVTKRANSSSAGRMPMHHDAWMIDHRVERAPSIWCPLVVVGPAC